MLCPSLREITPLPGSLIMNILFYSINPLLFVLLRGGIGVRCGLVGHFQRAVKSKTILLFFLRQT